MNTLEGHDTYSVVKERLAMSNLDHYIHHTTSANVVKAHHENSMGETIVKGGGVSSLTFYLGF
jgi:hypothetical protein